MSDRLRVTELDFDAIKQNLKTFLNQQSEFTDYDFDGSALSVLLDILAYNTHYQAYYVNMVANESFLDTALLRDSVVSHAKSLGYTPYSKSAAVATIDLEVKSPNSIPGSLTIPKGYIFLSNQIDGVVYNFNVIDDVTVSKSNTSYFFENLGIYEGRFLTYRFVQNDATNPKQLFTIPEVDIDTTTIEVSVAPSSSNTQLEIYNKVTDITEVTGTDPVYFLQEGRDGKYQIYFGNGIIGKKIPDGAIVNVNYLLSNGALANKANNFVASFTLYDTAFTPLTNFVITPISAAAGGSDRESVDEIKYGAPAQYTSQNRIVTKTDYEVFIKRSYSDIDDVAVWGGEEEVPPMYGKVFISLKPKSGYYISETEKTNIINDIISKSTIVTLKTEIRDPDYLYVMLRTNVQYDTSKTAYTEESLKLAIKSAILRYQTDYLNTFGSKFVVSKLNEYINDVDTYSILGCDTNIKLEKRFYPTLNQLNTYTVNYNTALLQGNPLNKLTSSEFSVYDASGALRVVTLEEIPKSYTGISAINILDGGANYTTAPTVTIYGDGFGATAEATLLAGRISAITITNRGTDYTTATVVISGDGTEATAEVLLDINLGTLRTIYYDVSANKQIVNSNAGTIDYASGIIQLSDVYVVSTKTTDSSIRIDCVPKSGIVQISKNTILSIDASDPTSIVTNLEKV